MNTLGTLLALLATAALFSPRQTGRFLAKIVIGYRAQLRDEGEA
jgi:hypothetical protein